MQLAAAAYACTAASVAAPAAAAMAEMPSCEGHISGAMDPDQPQLCRAHCQQGSQTVQPTPASDVPASSILLTVLDWTQAALLPVQPAGRLPVVSSGAPPPGSPPLYLSLLVLRN
jgi:hypothetical protein